MTPKRIKPVKVKGWGFIDKENGLVIIDFKERRKYQAYRNLRWCAPAFPKDISDLEKMEITDARKKGRG